MCKVQVEEKQAHKVWSNELGASSDRMSLPCVHVRGDAYVYLFFHFYFSDCQTRAILHGHDHGCARVREHGHVREQMAHQNSRLQARYAW